MTRRRAWLIRIVAIASLGAAAGVAIADGARGWPSGGAYLRDGATASVFIVVGWLIAERKPGNTVGPLLLSFGVLYAWYLPADLYLHLPGRPPGSEFAALFISMLDAPMFILLALVLILFPDGRPLSPRWRSTVWAGVAGIVLVIVGTTLQAGPFRLFPDFDNPTGIANAPGDALVYAGYTIMLVLLVLAAGALVIRWRRGTPTERTQIKWVVAATIVLLLAEAINVATFRPDQMNALPTLATSVAISLVPISMGVAILRYHLYEIDRIISRTIAYGALTVILAMSFAAVIVSLQSLLDPFTQGQTIAVAASTLIVFALFQPVRQRVQSAVDRRFDRARFDAERTTQAFAGRLRHQTDMTAVTSDLAATTSATVAPRSLSIWLRPKRARD